MTDQDFFQFLLDKLNEGYEEYKRNHPDFAHVGEEQSEGKPDAEFKAQFTQKEKEDWLKEHDWNKDHCLFCGEYLPYGFDMCPECGRLQVE